MKQVVKVLTAASILLAALTLGLGSASADGAAQSLPFSQDWTNIGLITTNDDWSGVPGIVGYRGDNLTAANDVDPQTVLADETTIDVNANQTNPNTFSTGGVAEFQIADPVVALQGSGTADAPFVALNLNTSGFSAIAVGYNLRDVDGSTDNAAQQVALQYRVGSSGNFTNVPAGYVADATSGPSLATLVTQVNAVLPADADNQPLVQMRVITTNATGNDEWVGIDDLSITGTPVVAVNEPVVVDCGGALSTLEGTSASQPVSASDADGTVIDIAITAINPIPAAGSITLSGLVPAGGAGGTATAQVDVDALVPIGTYTVDLSATNDDGTPQTGTCSLTVTVVSTVQPVIAACDGPLTAFEGIAASQPVSASDADGTVIDILINDVAPSAAPGSISLGSIVPAGAVGGTATAAVEVDAAVPPGTYTVLLTATNNDITPQSGTCSLSVNVLDILPIGAVQGSVDDSADGFTHRSPYAPPSGNSAGSTQVIVQGVIYEKTLARTSAGGSQNGFFLQNAVASADSDPNSSDGAFVFMGNFTSLIGGYVPVVGDEVILRARVTEFFNLTELTSATALMVVRSGVDLDTELAAFDANPPDDFADAGRYWERREGMRARIVPGSVVLNGRNVFPSTMDGEVWLAHPDSEIAGRSGYERRSFRDPHPLDNDPALFDDGNGYRIVLGSLGIKAAAGDKDALIAPSRTFDVVQNAPVGGVYFSFNKYQIQIEQQLELEDGPNPADNAPPQAFDRSRAYSVATFNVENLYDYRDDPFDGCDFTGNAGCPGVNPPFDYVPASDAAYQTRLGEIAAQIVDELHAPDLILVQEAEDQDICTGGAGGFSCGSTNNADGRPDTLQELAQVILDQGGPAYESAYDRDGADDRGIVSAFLYRTDRVELLPAAADDPVLGSSPTVDYRGSALGYNTDVQNPKVLNADLPDDVDLSTGVDGANVFTRPAQVGLFRLWRDGVGTSVFVDVYALSNHFSSTPNARVGQRTEQAAYAAAIVDALQAATSDVFVIVGGDLNVYPRPDDPFVPGQSLFPSDQLGPLYDQGLVNLWDTLVAQVPEAAYSYVFEGQAQTLDQIFLTPSLQAEFERIRAAHINSDWPSDYVGDGARGTSDHDPQVARVSLLPTLDRLEALLDYFAGTGDITGNNTVKNLMGHLDSARRALESGNQREFEAQLQAFANQVMGFSPRFITPEAAEALVAEAELLSSGGG